MTVHSTLRVSGRKRHREEIAGGIGLDLQQPFLWPDAAALLSLIEPSRKRRRREDGIKFRTVIQNKHLKLTLEIGCGPGYFLHTGEIKGRAVIIKVFNQGPTVREQLKSMVALSKRFMHPNLLRLEGTSSPTSCNHFIAYENTYWKTADGPLTSALKNDLTRGVALGFEMIAGLSSGLNHLSTRGIPLASLGVENFDVFLDIDDRFLISINPEISTNQEVAEDVELEDDTNRSWDIFHGLCEKGRRHFFHPRLPVDLRRFYKVLRSANHQDIERHPMFIYPSPAPSIARKSPPASRLSSESESVPFQENVPEISPVPPRRDAHRCAGYIREEITLATTLVDSAVVSHDTPSPLEVCSVCHEVVDFHEVFHYICGDPDPGSRPVVKCQACRLWSHSECVVGDPKEFICQFCDGPSVFGPDLYDWHPGRTRQPVQPTLPAFKTYAQPATFLFEAPLDWLTSSLRTPDLPSR
ncbi:hypothetical protein DFH09DRAFT_1399342 [Mycena vulgaris]|nr:hypothetical protein DFH09DRAFT_1399342 [Mycena vulgaris]